MARVPFNDRLLLLAKLAELHKNQSCAGESLYGWAKAHGRGILSRCPSLSACYRLEKKFKKMGDIYLAAKDMPRSQVYRGGKYATISAKVKCIIIKKARDSKRPNYKRRAYELAKEQHAGRRVSLASTKRVLKEGNIVFRRMRSKPHLISHHKTMRFKWAQRYVSKPVDFWKGILFSDETTFEIARKPHHQNDGFWVSAAGTSEQDNQGLSCPAFNNIIRLNVWGGIAFCGKTGLCLIEGTNNETSYKKIIKENVKPFMKAHKNLSIFQQDNAPVHTSANVQKFLDAELGRGKWSIPPPKPCHETDKEGNVLKPKVVVCKNGQTRHYSIPSTKCNCDIPNDFFHPANSPDMAPMEHIWAYMEMWINRHPPPTNEKDLKALIFAAWAAVPDETIHNILIGMPKRIRALHDAKGGNTKY
jgi:hypothetical protein